MNPTIRLRHALLVASLLILLGCSVGNAVDLHVAPGGDDRATGHADAPLATVSAALERVAALRRTDPQQGITIRLADGRHEVREPIRIGLEHAGPKMGALTLAAAPNARPVLSGSVIVSNWRQEAGGVWSAPLPKRDGRPVICRVVYVNGRRATLARTPNEGYFRIQGPPPRDLKTNKTLPQRMGLDHPGDRQGHPRDGFRFKPGDLEVWPDLEHAEINAIWHWIQSVRPIERIDMDEHVVVVPPAPVDTMYYGQWQYKTNKRYFVQNLRAALDAPGEWLIDRKANRLLYIPRPGEDMATTEVLVPVVETVLKIEGDPEAETWVDDVHLKGISFRHTDCSIPATGYSGKQAAVTMPAAVEAVGAHGCSMTDCEVTQVAAHGVWFRYACSENRFERNDIHRCGGGGLYLGNARLKTEHRQPGTRSERNVIHNNYIHDITVEWKESVGIFIGQSSYNQITHNEIAGMDYSGISLGFSWNWGDHTQCRGNLVEWNNIHHCGRGVMNDLGGIYTLGYLKGTVIRNNRIHQCWSWAEGYGGRGIYLDEGSLGVLMENNLVYGSSGEALTLKGRSNTARNNVFYISGEQTGYGNRRVGAAFDGADEQVAERNIFVVTGPHAWQVAQPDLELDADYNVYFKPNGPLRFYFRPDYPDWKGWQAKGIDRHSVVGDPKFVHIDDERFELASDSPALKLGFKPFDVSNAGLVGDPAWTGKPSAVNRPDPESDMWGYGPGIEIRDGFERTQAGTPADYNASSSQGNRGASVKVSADRAASGKHSLKFVDAAGQRASYNPHVFYQPSLAEGTVRGSYQLYLGEGQPLFVNDWRSHNERKRGEYAQGPRIAINHRGEVEANDRQVGRAPTGRWLTVEITCAVGDRASGRYDLTLRDGAKVLINRRGLTCDRDFTALGWMGMLSYGDQAGTFYLDDVVFEQE